MVRDLLPSGVSTTAFTLACTPMEFSQFTTELSVPLSGSMMTRVSIIRVSKMVSELGNSQMVRVAFGEYISASRNPYAKAAMMTKATPIAKKGITTGSRPKIADLKIIHLNL